MKRRSKRKSRKSRKRRAGANIMDDAAFKKKMGDIAAKSAETMAKADKAVQDAAKVKQAASEQERLARTSKLPSICRLDIMKGTKRCMKDAKKVEEGAKVLMRTSAGIKAKADALKKAGLSKLGGKRKRRRTKRRRKSRKSKKSRRKARKTKRRRKSRKRRSRRRR